MREIFELLFENMVFPIWIKDLDLKFIFANKKYEEIINIKLDEIIGAKNEELFEPSICERYNNNCLKVLETLEPITEYTYDNNEYRQCTIIPLINKNNKLVGVAGIIGEITEIERINAKEYEVEMQKNLTEQIMDILPGVIFFKDKESKYVYANKPCTDFYVDRGVDNIFGKTDFEINPDKKQAEKFMQDDKNIIYKKVSVYNEVIFKDKNGQNIYKEVVKMPLIDKDGHVTGIVGRSLDITEKKRIQKRLEYLSYTDILTGAKNRAFFEEQEEVLCNEKHLPLGVIMGDADGLKLVNDTFGHREGDNLLIQITNIIKDVCKEKGEVFRIGGDEFVILIPNATLKICEETIVKILKRCKEYKGDLFKISISLGAAIKYNSNKDIYEVLKEAEDKVYRQKLLQKKSIKSSILNSLKIGLGVSSGETEQHTKRVAISAVKVGKKLKLERSELDELKIAADFHDIGKIGISEEILLKPEPLTKEEYEIMKTHTEKGYRIIKASSELRSVAEIVLYHHERWDGKGYSIGLKGEEIPLLARIISVCDSYDVMTNDRIYKKAIGREEAIEQLKKGAGTQFDPKIVEVFIECIK